MPAIRIILLLLLATGVHAAPSELTIGATLPLSGAQLEQGQMVQDGLQVALMEAGPGLRKRIRLDILDDRGDPATAARNAEKLITQGQAQVLAGCVGEAVCAAVEAVARRHQVPLLGAVQANAAVCREKSLAFCFHTPYAAEAEAIARQLKTLGARVVYLWLSEELAGYAPDVAAVFVAHNLAVSQYRPAKAPSGTKPFPATANRPDEAHVFFLNNADAVAASRTLRQRQPGALAAALSSVEPFRWLQQTQGISTGMLVAHSMPNPDLAKSRLTKAYQKAIASFSAFNLPYEYSQLEIYLVGRLLTQLADRGIADKQAVARALGENEYRIDDFAIAFPNGRRTLSVPVGLSVVSRNGVLLE